MPDPVVLLGPYGHDNPSEEALLTAVLRGLPDDDVVVVSADPAATRQRHDVEAVGRDALALGRLVRRSRALVVGGGTLFTTVHPSTGRAAHDVLGKALALATLARTTGTNVALVGVGAGRLPDARSRALTRRLAALADLLVVRDEETAHALVNAGVPPPLRVGADLSWVLPSRPTTTPQEREQRAVVAVSAIPGSRTDDVAPLVADVTERLRAAGLAVDLQPWQAGGRPGSDAAVAEAAAARLADPEVRVVERPRSLVHAAEEYACLRLVVSMRFHGLVAAGSAGTPALAVAHESKMAGLARRLQLPTLPLPASASALDEAVSRALAAEPASRDAVQHEEEAAEGTLGLLRLLVTGGDERSAAPDATAALSLEPTPW